MAIVIDSIIGIVSLGCLDSIEMACCELGSTVRISGAVGTQTAAWDRILP